MKRKGAGQKVKNKRYLIGQVKQVESPNFVMNPAELKDHLPQGEKFNIKRVYWITSPKGDKRSSQHAHTNEDEIFIVLQGKAHIILDDEGKRKKSLKLEKNDIVWVPRYVWHGLDRLGSESIVLALSSTNYDPERKGYIDDYQKFRAYLAKKK